MDFLKNKKGFPFLLSYRLLFIVICFMVCCLQIRKISEIYFSVWVTTLVNNDNVLSVTVSVVSICMSKSDLLREEYLLKLGHNQSDHQIEHFLNNMSIYDQLEALSSAKDFFGNDCEIMRSKIMNDTTQDYVHCSQISPIRTSIDNHNICITLFSQLKRESTESYSLEFDVSIVIKTIFNDFTDNLL